MYTMLRNIVLYSLSIALRRTKPSTTKATESLPLQGNSVTFDHVFDHIYYANWQESFSS